MRIDVRQEPHGYGKGPGSDPEKIVGSYEFDEHPVAGQELELEGEVWVVTEVHADWVYVRPTPHGEGIASS